MEESLYFYLEPYVYVKKGEKELLIVNLLDDKAIIFKDSASIKIGNLLLSSQYRTIKITENDKNIPIVINAIKNYMGDIVSAMAQPLQFDSEINNLSGIEAYRKATVYSKYNIGGFISNCTMFVDMKNQDSYDYIKCTTGIESTPENAIYNASFKMNEEDIDYYIQELIKINPNIILNICGVNQHLFDYISSNYPSTILNPVISLRTLQLYPDILNRIKKKKLRYTLLLDLSHDNYNCYINDELCSIYVKVTNDKDLYNAYNLSETGCQVKLCPILTSKNKDFIKSLFSISSKELLNIKNKYRTIKINNLINSNFWGNIYLFPQGKVRYSLGCGQLIEFHQLYEKYKNDFLNGSFEWTFIRNFSNCSTCIFQYLCPSPNYIETHLREKNLIKCLISKDAKVSS